MSKRQLTGINIQFPISNLIASGAKTIETRTYPIPEDYIDREIALVETPGKNGKFKSRVIAVIRFDKSFKYGSKKEFYQDIAKHCVTPESPWAWNPTKPKWSWPVQVLEVLAQPVPVKKRLGIKYTKNITIP